MKVTNTHLYLLAIVLIGAVLRLYYSISNVV